LVFQFLRLRGSQQEVMPQAMPQSAVMPQSEFMPQSQISDSAPQRRISSASTAVERAAHPIIFVLASGMGLLLDKYLLQTGNVVDQFMTGNYDMEQYETGDMKSIFKASTLMGYPIGMGIFGPLSDVLGRRTCLISTSVLTCAGAIGCTVSWNPIVIVLFRFITGIGAGGEYPLAACHVSESGDRASGAKNVGYLYLFGSGLGQAMCPLVAIILVALFPTEPSDCKEGLPSCNETHNQIVWRGTFGVAGFLSLVCLLLRILTTRNSDKFERSKIASPMSMVAKYWRPLLGTSLSWFFYDVVEYGLKNNDVQMFAAGGDIMGGLLTSFENLMFSMPFLLVAVLFVGSFATKYAQLVGFVGLTVINAGIACFDESAQKAHEFLFKVLYILQTGFQAFTGISTIAIPADIFPSPVRGTCHGISSVSGKIGAIFGAYYFNYVNEDDYDGIMAANKIQWIFIVVTICGVAGTIVTITLTPKYDGPQLEAMDEQVDNLNHQRALQLLYGRIKVNGGDGVAMTTSNQRLNANLT
jgi:PHS family inorganic phosphate transporter-like MFS transporter